MTTNNKQLTRALELIDELNAVLLLEYHNRNWLYHGTQPGRLNEEQRNLIASLRNIIAKEATGNK